MNERNKRGMGERQLHTANKARESILKILSDGEWHQYKEIGQKAKLSNVTLSKHLKEFKKGIEKKESEEDSRIVYYRIKASYLILARSFKGSLDEWRELRKTLFTTKNPLLVLKEIDKTNDLAIMLDLTLLKLTKDVNMLNLFLELTWERYKFLTAFLVQETREFLEEINPEQLARSIKEF